MLTYFQSKIYVISLEVFHLLEKNVRKEKKEKKKTNKQKQSKP